MKKLKWQEKIIYQIFPRSFYDYNNDGNGDIKGIIQKLDYIKWLGADAIWLCPIYDTKFEDAGYDVLDYYNVWEKFGTLDDFKELIIEAKKRNIEIIMDIVLNHTSSSHSWFKKAINDPTSKEFNYYIWSDKPTKNESIFGGSAWEYVPSIKKYYFHLFTKDQADLNWENDNTIKAMADVIKFWYDLGVKGFRLDAVQHVHKEIDKNGNLISSFASKVTEFLKKLNNFINIKKKEDIFFLGESSGMIPQWISNWTTGKNKIVDNFYNFSWWWIGWNKKTGRNGYDSNWTYKDFYNKNFIEYQSNEKILNNAITIFLSNHDTSRAISRWGNENLFWEESAKSLALLQFSLRGLMCIYYGEEIGMLNTVFNKRDEFKDADVINSFKILVDTKKYYTEEEMLRAHNINSRDHSRIPMLWNYDEKNYGFSNSEKTWIKLNDNFKKTSVNTQSKNSNSILNFYRKLINLRKNSQYSDILINGKFSINIKKNGEVAIIERKFNNKTIITYVNLSNHAHKIIFLNKKELLLSSYNEIFFQKNYLRPYESIMFYKKEK